VLINKGIWDSFGKGLITVFFLFSFIVGTRNRTQNNGEQTNTRLNINRCNLSGEGIALIK
jgi:hypothetical protein